MYKDYYKMIKLYHFPLCPFSRRIRLLLSESNLDFELLYEIPWDRRPEFLALNPAGTLPVIIDENDKNISGIYSITEYIEEILSLNKSNFIFGDIYNKSEIRRIMEWFDVKFNAEVTQLILKEMVNKFYINKSDGGGSPNMEIIRIAQENMIYHLDYISYLSESRGWLAGDRISEADFAVAAHLSCLDYLNKVPWDKADSVKNWYARIKSRPSFSNLLKDELSGFITPAHYADLDF